MEALEVSGKNVDEAVETALEQMGVTRDDVNIEIIHEARRSILGLGGEDALVRVTPIASSEERNGGAEPGVEAAEASNIGQEVLNKLLELMDVEGEITMVTSDDQRTPPMLEIDTPNPGVLIGRRGQALSALQYMVNFIASRQLKSGVKVLVDVADYRKRRKDELESMAVRVAELVKTNRRSITLEPMGAWERRIIHLTLREERGISTGSTGFGERRKVVISPKK